MEVDLFTGLIAGIGSVAKIRQRTGGIEISFFAANFSTKFALGDSVAVNGACLTVEQANSREFSVFASEESLSKTTLKSLRPGDRVNLEPALGASGHLGGHIVQGHVEGVGEVVAFEKSGRGASVSVSIPPGLLKYVVAKGSIALDGVSLTVARLKEGTVEVAVIPFTLESTTIGHWRTSKVVNVETDIVGRYIVDYIERGYSKQFLTVDGLKGMGF